MSVPAFMFHIGMLIGIAGLFVGLIGYMFGGR